MERSDVGGGVRSTLLGGVGALLIVLLAVPALADEDDAAHDDAAHDDAAHDDDAEEGEADAEPTIRTLASNRHMLVKARSLRLTEEAADRLLEVARLYHEDTRRKLVVTGGERNAGRQAELMYKKLENEEDLLKLYARDDLVRPIIAAYERGREDRRSKKHTLRGMTEVIQGQVDQKQYVSRHLAFTAADVRSRDMTPESVSAFRAAVKSVPGVVLIDERKSAAPCFHLSM